MNQPKRPESQPITNSVIVLGLRLAGSSEQLGDWSLTQVSLCVILNQLDPRSTLLTLKSVVATEMMESDATRSLVRIQAIWGPIQRD